MKQVRQLFYKLKNLYQKLPEIIRFVLYLLALSYFLTTYGKLFDLITGLFGKVIWAKQVGEWLWPPHITTIRLFVNMIVGALIVVALSILSYKQNNPKSENHT